MAIYNLTNITDANNMYYQVKAVNDLSNGLLFGMIMTALFFIFLVTFKRRDIKQVLIGDFFFMIIIAGIAWGLDFVGWAYIIIPILGFIASLIAFLMLD